PAYSVTDAFGTLHSGEHIDAAILDVELGDGVVFPFADYLKERGIPYLFASGVYPYAVPQAHQDVPFVGKPYQLEHLLEQLDQVWAADVARRG
ncbi:MAG: response regulator, partial [Stenotrophomonas chelatiphaga]